MNCICISNESDTFIILSNFNQFVKFSDKICHLWEEKILSIDNKSVLNLHKIIQKCKVHMWHKQKSNYDRSNILTTIQWI